jgi:hypothetical protein
VERLTGLAIYLVILVCGILVPEYFLFPLGLTYTAYGVLRALILSLGERPNGPPPSSTFASTTDSEEQAA